MNKKIIFPLTGVLFLVIFLTILLPFILKKDNKEKNQQNITQDNQSTSLSTREPTQSTTNILQNTNDFKVEYSTQTDKYVVTTKTESGQQKANDWLVQNNLSTTNNNIQVIDQSELAANPEISNISNNISSKIATTTYPTLDVNSISNANKNTDSLIEVLSTIFNGEIINTPTLSISPSTDLIVSPTSKKKTAPTTSDKYIYYSQCGGSFDSYPLPSGCTVCEAGCGPTTVAMIAASYSDKSITPKTVVDLYKQKGYFLSCAGSRYTDAKLALGSYGIKTTDYMIFNLATIDTAAKDFKNYLSSGWTIFVLTNFCDAGCGHFFWITEISNNNDTWAYDPYYGKGQKPPYNEKSRYPFPKYRVAFGVKK